MINEISDTFKTRLNVALQTKNIKQIDLAKATGISKSTISSYLSGRYIPKKDAINKISEYLDCTPQWLFGYELDKHLNEDFSICIKDDTMQPNIMKNDTVIIHRQTNFSEGDIIAITINNTTCIRKIYTHNKTIVLLPFNSKYKPTIIAYKELKMLGIVKQIIREI